MEYNLNYLLKPSSSSHYTVSKQWIRKYHDDDKNLDIIFYNYENRVVCLKQDRSNLNQDFRDLPSLFKEKVSSCNAQPGFKSSVIFLVIEENVVDFTIAPNLRCIFILSQCGMVYRADLNDIVER